MTTHPRDSRLSASRKITAVAFALCLLAAAFANSARAARILEEAQTALENQPAYRMKSILEIGPIHDESITETVVMRGGPVYQKDTTNGHFRVEFITDGKREFLRAETGEQSEVHGVMLGIVEDVIKQASLRQIIRDTYSEALVGQEETNGVMASVYAYNNMADETKTRVWIADADHRPLKAESEYHSPYADGYSRLTNITFDYDPAVKIVMPTSAETALSSAALAEAPGVAAAKQGFTKLTWFLIGALLLGAIVIVGIFFYSQNEEWD